MSSAGGRGGPGGRAGLELVVGSGGRRGTGIQKPEKNTTGPL